MAAGGFDDLLFNSLETGDNSFNIFEHFKKFLFVDVDDGEIIRETIKQSELLGYFFIEFDHIYVHQPHGKYIYPRIFTFAEHSVSGEPWYENIGIIYYSKFEELDDERELGKVAMNHPYVIYRNDKTRQLKENEDYFPIRPNHFFKDVERWDAFIINDNIIDDNIVQNIIEYQKNVKPLIKKWNLDDEDEIMVKPAID